MKDEGSEPLELCKLSGRASCLPAPALSPCAGGGSFTSDLAGSSLMSKVARVSQLLGPSLPCSALPPQKFDELLQLASRGRHANVDMLVQDIYGGAHQTLGLSGNLIASSFGKSATADRGNCWDLPFTVTQAWPVSVPRASLCPLVWRDRSHRTPETILAGLWGSPSQNPTVTHHIEAR